MSDCIETQYSKRGGYGLLVCVRNGVTKRRSHHRVVYADTRGLNVDTMGGSVLHSCDNPGCVNPDHLSLGTHTENMQDMQSKGRGVQHKGEQHARSILTDEAVAYIRDNYIPRDPEFGGKALARTFGVHNSTVSCVIRGKLWKEVS